MALHRLASVTVGVPNVAETGSYYTDFGLTESVSGTFATVDGGDQLILRPAATRRLLAIEVGADDVDDLGRAAKALARLDVPVSRGADTLVVTDPVSDIEVTLRVAPRFVQPPTPAMPYNGPGRIERPDTRAPGILREGPVRPRNLGHVVIGSVDKEASQRFFTEGLGFKVTDDIKGIAAFMRCSTDHHNVLVQQAPLNFLHHTAWQVDDVDDVGRGATAMLEDHPERHVWGLGRHHIGSNFFWYLRDPAGNFSEYYSDLDCILDDQLWKPDALEGARALYAWGPPVPPSFLLPEDLGALMTGTHAAR
ncbi:VOC family protein [Streptomyces sp. NPDC096132]|uniref:VOC family protein n=1 Tax=Streptomyces sp. NPDC096132 TaxID=3366075 RepID=UPI00382E514A